MDPLFVPSLLPILVVTLALGVGAWRLGRTGLAAWSLATAAWATSLLLAVLPSTRAVGERLLLVGFCVPAAYLHAVAHTLGARPWPIRAAWAVAGAMTGAGALWPQLFLLDQGTTPGPLYLPMACLAVGLTLAPLLLLRGSSAAHPDRLRTLALGGLLGAGGGGLTVLSMRVGQPSAAGLYGVLASVLLLALMVQGDRLPAFGPFVDRSLRFSLAAALLSGLWVGVLWALLRLGGGVTWSWGVGLLLILGATAGQPLLAWFRGALARRFFPGQGDLPGMALALARSEARAEHARRLAGIGVLSSSVAHEVRNPLGVIAACVTVLRRQGADPGVLDEIQAQVTRSAAFADALLEYGRPAPLSLRAVEPVEVVRVAASEVTRALDVPLERVEIRGQAPPVEADLVQLGRLVAILLENALLVASRVQVDVEGRGAQVVITVEDDGPGVPEDILERLFQPFQSGRGRTGPRPGTGLGLAIARGIAERHQGSLEYRGRGARLGGATFQARLPLHPPLPVEG